MKKTKVFMSGNSQAVRLPKEFRIEAPEVYIKREGRRLVLIPVEEKWEDLFERLEKDKDLLEDFLLDRNQPKAQGRKLF